jgi:uncharacterized damage-inducible protein DinB
VRSELEDAFAHHVWATMKMMDICDSLTPEQLETAVPGTYGSILDTMRHIVGADSWYLFDIGGDPAFSIEEETMDLSQLRQVMERDRSAWPKLLAEGHDPDEVVHEEEEGFSRDATFGIRLAQAIHHGTDHRSQICTALTSLGIEPPDIDVWDYGASVGSVVKSGG